MSANENNIPEDSEQLNEGIFDFIKAATGAVKNFFNGITAPFKNFKTDLQKGLELEEAKTAMSKKLDEIGASAIKSINGAKEKSEIMQMQETFLKNIDSQLADFDKSISTVKESQSINEGKIQDALIGGRVFIGLVKDEFQRLSTDFEKKFAAAKDIAAAKTEAVNLIKNTIASAKKKIADAKTVTDAITQYKEEKNIKTEKAAGGQGTIVLDWGDVEVELEVPKEGKSKRYKITKSNSKILKVIEGKGLFCDVTGEAKKGQKVKFTNITETEEGGEPLKFGGRDFYETGNLEKIVVDGKEVDNYKFVAPITGGDVKAKLGDSLKGLDDDKMSKVTKFTDFIKNDANKDKVAEIEKILGESATKNSYFDKTFGTFIRG